MRWSSSGRRSSRLSAAKTGLSRLDTDEHRFQPGSSIDGALKPAGLDISTSVLTSQLVRDPGRLIDASKRACLAARLNGIRESASVIKQRATRFWEHRRPRSMTTGRIFCGACGSPMTTVGKDYLGCIHARRRGVCTNRRSVRRSQIEQVILGGLQHELMDPDNVKEFVDAFQQELNRERAAANATRGQLERESDAIDARIEALVDAIESGVRNPSVLGALDRLEARKRALAEELASPPVSIVRIHPNLGEVYRRRIADLRASLGDTRLRSEAAEIVRDLIDRIIIHPADGHLELELVGEIAAMVELAIDRSSENRKAALRETALSATDRSSVKVVAGARNHRKLTMPCVI